MFLTVAVVQFFVDVSEKEAVFASLKTGLISVMLLIMFFTYMDSGADLGRIWREYNERDAYLARKAAEGAEDVTKISLMDGKLAGAEALVRWETEDGRTLYPNDFIPLFEENSFCTRLDLYMVECACRHIRRWMEAGIAPAPISVNQTRLLFYDADYPQKLKELVERYKIPAGLITLEILEGLAIGNVDEMNEKIVLLQEEGFRISMDDFGSGYSSLNVMGALKIDELKLDRAFLMEVAEGNNLRQRAVMEMVIGLTRRLKIATVAEGVETQEDERLIRELGCDMGQGYFYSRKCSCFPFCRILKGFPC